MKCEIKDLRKISKQLEINILKTEENTYLQGISEILLPIIYKDVNSDKEN